MRVTSSILFFVAVLGGALAAALASVDAGLHESAVVPGVTVLAALVVLVAQRLRPFAADWRNYRRDLRVDLLHAIFSTGGANTLVELAAIGLLVSVSGRVSAAIGGQLWPSDLPLAAQTALALVIAELGAYWVHRLAHRFPLLWRIHALHHSSERLYAVNSARNHPLNVALVLLATLGPLVVLGASPRVLLLVSVFTSVHGVIQHSNLDLHLGPLDWVFASPALHRRHHHVEVERSNSNFGSNLILWDLVFGTRVLPTGEVNDRVGLPDMAFTGNFVTHLLSPFRLDRLARPVEALLHAAEATEEVGRRAAETARTAGRRVVEVTNEFAEAGERVLAEASASASFRVRRE